MGLMGRDALADGSGLWLPGSNGIHMMFMRFPIDAVFLGSDQGADPGGAGTDGPVGRRVVSVHRAIPAWRGLVPLVRGASGVLELPAGTIDTTGTVVGDLVRLEPPRGAEPA